MALAPGRRSNAAAALFILAIFWTTFSFPTRWDSEYFAVNSSSWSYKVNGAIQYAWVPLTAFLLLTQFPRVGRRMVSGALWAVLILLALLSCAWSIEFKTTLFAGTGMVCLFVILSYVAAELDEVTASRIIVWYAIALCGVSMLVALVLPQYGEMNVAKFSGQLRGIYSHKNFMGEVAGLLVVWLMCARFAGQVAGWPFLLAIALSLAAVAWSWSVTIILMLILCFGLLLAFRSAFVLRLPTVVMVGAVMTIIVVALIVVPLMSDTILGFFGKDSTLTGRDVIWRAYLDLGSQRQPIGWGYRALIATDKVGISIVFPNGSRPSAHNSFIQLYCELGAPAVLLYVVATVALILNGIRRLGNRDPRGLFAMVLPVGYAVDSFMEGNGAMAPNIGFVMMLYIALRPRFAPVPLLRLRDFTATADRTDLAWLGNRGSRAAPTAGGK